MLNQQQPCKQAGVQPPPQRHYHQPVAPHGSDTIYHVMAGLFALMFFALLIVGIVQAHAQVAQLSVYLLYVALAGALIVLGYAVWHTWHMDKLKRKHAELDIQAKEQQMQSDKEAHEMQMYLAQTRLYPDVIGNKPSVFNPKPLKSSRRQVGTLCSQCLTPMHLISTTNTMIRQADPSRKGKRTICSPPKSGTFPPLPSQWLRVISGLISRSSCFVINW